MASTAPDTPAAAAAAVPKKTRLNPARRKAAAKSQSSGQVPTAAATASPASKDTVTSTSISKPLANSSTPPALKALTRTKTTPAVTAPNQVPSSTPALKPAAAVPATKESKTKPNLIRSATVPQSLPSHKKSSLALSAPALVTGGLVGCAAGAALILGVGIWYDFSGAQSALLAARAAKVSFDNLADEVIASLKTGTYSADEALDMLRRTSLAYADAVPGGRLGVERVFREVEMVRKVRGREVEGLMGETFAALGRAGKKGAGSDEMQAIVVTQLGKLAGVGGRAAGDVVGRNPGLRPFGVEAGRGLGTGKEKEPSMKVNMVVRQKGK